VRLGPDAAVRLASDAGFEGLAFDGGCFLSDLPKVAAEGLKVGLALELCFAPVAPAPLEKGKRLPYLVALGDREERLEAQRLIRRNIEVGRGLGATRFVLDPGLVELTIPEADLATRFARAEMGAREPGARLRGRALAERRELSPRITDALRAGLEPLARVADDLGATLILLPAATPWQAPSPRELEILLRELTGAPVLPGLAPAWRAALAGIGLAGPSERWADLERRAGLLYATDGVGWARDLLPGLGEVWESLAPNALDTLPARAAVVVSGREDSSRDEVGAARDRLSELRRVAARSAGE
jgi:hypothetical protein